MAAGSEYGSLMSIVMGGLGCIPELSCRDRCDSEEDVRVRV